MHPNTVDRIGPVARRCPSHGLPKSILQSWFALLSVSDRRSKAPFEAWLSDVGRLMVLRLTELCLGGTISPLKLKRTKTKTLKLKRDFEFWLLADGANQRNEPIDMGSLSWVAHR